MSEECHRHKWWGKNFRRFSFIFLVDRNNTTHHQQGSIMMDGHVIRKAQIEDLEEIINIYNCSIFSKFETADTLKINWKKRISWFKNHKSETYPIFVYEIKGIVVGWISLSPYRKGRKALRFTIEISYYVHPEFKQKGIGSNLMEYVIEISRGLNYKTLLAIVLDKNVRSINLLTKYGFSKWGHLPNIADFDISECGHLYYGLRL